ncbi:LysM peptidoglycan-binding domain-containing protein [Gorillibacterium timonense]|uniref:LysM peptidoglycan-binding domain-containing protein n=1 Tax=Gorillibacterium timonense TaxID=1689269 RepID=UPI00071D813A|nr:LysM peptidoglycan-binding domain-containing protein [Gorillibacterium timonense]
MKIHVVKAGDTLFELAKKYNVNLDKLIAANPGLADPDKLEIGMKIKIPSGSVPVTPEGMHAHTVKQGDTMWKLSKAWGVPLKTLIDANPHITNPNILMTNQVVYIPKQTGVSGSHSMGYTTAATANPKANTAPVAQAPKANTAPVAQTPKASTAPVAQTPKANTAPVAETPKANTAPVVETPKANTAPVVEKPVENVKPVEKEKPAEVSPVENVKPAEKAKPVENEKPQVKPIEQAKPQAEAIQPSKPMQPSVSPSSVKPSGKPNYPQIPTISDIPDYPQTSPYFTPTAVSPSSPEGNPYTSEHLFMQYQVPAVEAFSNQGNAAAPVSAGNTNWPGYSPLASNNVNPLAAGPSASKDNAGFLPYSYGQQPLYSADQTPAQGYGTYPAASSPYVGTQSTCGCHSADSNYSPYGYPQGSAVSPYGYYPWTDGGNAPISPQAVAGTENAMISPYSMGGTENTAFSPYSTGTENTAFSPYSTGTENTGFSPYSTGTENIAFSPYSTGTENTGFSPYSTGTENTAFSPYSTGTENTGFSPYSTGTENTAFSPYSTGGAENAMISPYSGTENAPFSPYSATPYPTGKPGAIDPMYSYPQTGWGGMPTGYPARYPEVAPWADGGAYGGGLFPSGVPGVYNPASGPIPYPTGLYGFQPEYRDDVAVPAAALPPQAEVFTDEEEIPVKSAAAKKRKSSAKATLHTLARRSKKPTPKGERINNPWINQYR